MALMPTTRQGRFKFYRDRQRRRHKSMWSRKPYAPGLLPGDNSHMTRRGFDWSAYGLQAERVYPVDASYQCANNVYPAAWAIEPTRGVWGVPAWVRPPVFGWAASTNFRFAVLRYRFRRVRSVPRLWMLPRLAWKYPASSVPVDAFYPYEFYPSGRPNPNWERIQAGE